VFPEGTLESVRDNLSDTQIDNIKEAWESIKKQERENKGSQKTLDDIPLALPALSRALKLQKRAATVGFDWADTGPVIDKINEELRELEVEFNGEILQRSLTN
jgi:Protein containing tetrapyrrole methyltransferase domain and MazG-like (predicted pyrophosphatase) domain